MPIQNGMITREEFLQEQNKNLRKEIELLRKEIKFLKKDEDVQVTIVLPLRIPREEAEHLKVNLIQDWCLEEYIDKSRQYSFTIIEDE